MSEKVSDNLPPHRHGHKLNPYHPHHRYPPPPLHGDHGHPRPHGDAQTVCQALSHRVTGPLSQNIASLPETPSDHHSAYHHHHPKHEQHNSHHRIITSRSAYLFWTAGAVALHFSTLILTWLNLPGGRGGGAICPLFPFFLELTYAPSL